MTDVAAHPLSTARSVRVRSARQRDFDAIRRNHQITFNEHVAREPDFTEDAPFIDPYLADLARPFGWLRGIFAKKRVFALVAEDGQTVTGHIVYTRHSNNLGPYAGVICDLSIDPAHRHSGFGRALVEAMEQREASDGVTGFAASIWPNNTASQKLFAALGYAPFDGDTASTSPMQLVQKSVPFSTRAYLVMAAKSAALTLFVIAAGYHVSQTFFG